MRLLMYYLPSNFIYYIDLKVLESSDEPISNRNKPFLLNEIVPNCDLKIFKIFREILSAFALIPISFLEHP